MRLLRFGPPRQERPALLDEQGILRELTTVIGDIDATTLSPDSLARLQAINPGTLPEISGSPRIGPCIANSGKILCIGLNYSDHAAETGMTPPSEPIVFMKGTRVSGATDGLRLPQDSTHTDWEVELGVVIGTEAQYVDEATALDYVAGYCVANDISERHYQIHRGGQWTKGKSFPGFAPIGPWLVTRDQVADPQHLALWLDVNGERFQNGTTANMIFPVAHIVSYLSQFMTLYPGDVIMTGTPAGVGMGIKPEPVYLKPGDVVTLGIEGLGEQRMAVRGWKD